VRVSVTARHRAGFAAGESYSETGVGPCASPLAPFSRSEREARHRSSLKVAQQGGSTLAAFLVQPLTASDTRAMSRLADSFLRHEVNSPAWLMARALSVDWAWDSGRLAEVPVVSQEASRGFHGRAVRTTRRSPRRGSVPSLVHTDRVDFRMIDIGSIGRCSASDLRKNCGFLPRSHGGPDTGRAPDHRSTRRGRSRASRGPQPGRLWLGLRRTEWPAWLCSPRSRPILTPDRSRLGTGLTRGWRQRRGTRNLIYCYNIIFMKRGRVNRRARVVLETEKRNRNLIYCYNIIFMKRGRVNCRAGAAPGGNRHRSGQARRRAHRSRPGDPRSTAALPRAPVDIESLHHNILTYLYFSDTEVVIMSLPCVARSPGTTVVPPGQ
jgi:hypothetical protein